MPLTVDDIPPALRKALSDMVDAQHDYALDLIEYDALTAANNLFLHALEPYMPKKENT